MDGKMMDEWMGEWVRLWKDWINELTGNKNNVDGWIHAWIDRYLEPGESARYCSA